MLVFRTVLMSRGRRRPTILVPVVARGGSAMQRRRLERLMVHFAVPHTPIDRLDERAGHQAEEEQVDPAKARQLGLRAVPGFDRPKVGRIHMAILAGWLPGVNIFGTRDDKAGLCPQRSGLGDTAGRVDAGVRLRSTSRSALRSQQCLTGSFPAGSGRRRNG